MTTNGGQDPRRQSPAPATPQAEDGDLTQGLHRQSAHMGDPGTATQDRMHGIGPSRRAVDGFQRQRHVDQRAANCSGLLQTGNCAGDPFWMPPDGDWWNYPGIGGSPTNRSKGSIMAENPSNPSFDFAGGQTTSDTPLATWNVPVRTAYAVVSESELEVIRRRTITGFGHGTGGPGSGTYNCYSNCNCNCACACDCNCDCNCSCYPAGTLVTMADGSQKVIESLRPGDKVLGAFGFINNVDNVIIGKIGPSTAWLINDTYFVIGGHRVWDIYRGWVSPRPEDWYNTLQGPKALADFPSIFDAENPPQDGIYAPDSELPKQMRIGDMLAWNSVDTPLEVRSLTRLPHDGTITLYEPICHNGSGSYTVHGGLWTTGAPDYSFDFQKYRKAKPTE